MRKLPCCALLLLLALPLAAQDSNRPTYIAAVAGQATTAASTLSLEASATKGFRVVKVCVTSSAATAGAAVTVTIQRRTTASTGGTALTADGTGTTTVSRTDLTDATFPGIARLNGTPGTAGAVVDQFSFVVPEVGTVDAQSPPPQCVVYTDGGTKPPRVPAGVANGLSINVSSAGAGGLAGGSIRAFIVFD